MEIKGEACYGCVRIPRTKVKEIKKDNYRLYDETKKEEDEDKNRLIAHHIQEEASKQMIIKEA